MVVFSFWLFLCSFALMGAAMPDEEISYTEKRELQQLPEVDLQQLSEYELSDLEDMANDLDTYTVDQFPYRETFLKAYSRLEAEEGKVYTRTNYITQDGWIMPYIYTVTEPRRQKLIQALETVHKKTGLPLVYALAPQKNDMLLPLGEPYLDNYNSDENKAKLLERLKTREDFIEAVDIGTYFLNNFSLEERMKMYYKTDLHWSFEGAYNAAAYTCKSMMEAGILKCDTLPDRDDFIWQDFTGKNFLGDLNLMYSFIYPMNENIPYFCCKDTSQLSYWNDSGPVAREAIVGYGISKDELDYDGMSTNNMRYFRVENPSSRSEQKVLILKDSFQNATTDYFTEVFREVNVVDPRYKSDETILELVNQRDIDIILFLYHQNNISSELITYLQPPIENIRPSSSAVFVDGESKTFDAYNIGGNNYFKLRDVATVMSGTEKQFNVTWNGEKSCIELISGKPYKPVGGEMSKGDGKPKTAISNASTIYKDGIEVDLTAYTIEGNNYFKLRDLGKAFDFNVSWDNASKSIIINTSESYTDD